MGRDVQRRDVNRILVTATSLGPLGAEDIVDFIFYFGQFSFVVSPADPPRERIK
jgi:hypothetical protein